MVLSVCVLLLPRMWCTFTTVHNIMASSTHAHAHTHNVQIIPTSEEVLPAFLYFIEQTVASPISYSPTTTSHPKQNNMFASFLERLVMTLTSLLFHWCSLHFWSIIVAWFSILSLVINTETSDTDVVYDQLIHVPWANISCVVHYTWLLLYC